MEKSSSIVRFVAAASCRDFILFESFIVEVGVVARTGKSFLCPVKGVQVTGKSWGRMIDRICSSTSSSGQEEDRVVQSSCSQPHLNGFTVLVRVQVGHGKVLGILRDPLVAAE